MEYGKVLNSILKLYAIAAIMWLMYIYFIIYIIFIKYNIFLNYPIISIILIMPLSIVLMEIIICKFIFRAKITSDFIIGTVPVSVLFLLIFIVCVSLDIFGKIFLADRRKK